MTNSYKVSVVIPVYIREPSNVSMTVKCIEYARNRTDINFELIIVETGSDYFKEYSDIHIYEKNRTNTAISVNHGWRVASGDYVSILTNDVFVTRDWLQCLIDCFTYSHNCGIATLANTEHHHVKENKIIENIWFPVSMYKRSITERLGYYDEEYDMVWEDTDMLVRMYKEGYKMYMNYNCVVEHLVGKTLHGEKNHSERYMRGRMRFNEKHAGCNLPIFEAVK